MLAERSTSARPDRAPDLLDLLADGATPHGRCVFPGGEETTSEQLWRLSERVAALLREFSSPGETIAMILTAAPAVLAVLIGALRAGLRVASLPVPARAQSVDDYFALVERLVQDAEARFLVVEASYEPFFRDRLTTRTAESIARGRSGRPSEAAPPGALIQFSSGTTGCSPRGVVLPLSTVGANIVALLCALEPRPGDVTCSWLPLSHDMGLVGMCLAPWAAAAPCWAGGGTAVLMRPEVFLADPSDWLVMCCRHRATITAAPTFALDAVARHLSRSRLDLDLSRLRALVVGAEVVRPGALRKFAAATWRHGFDELAFCPAYGLAEATLALTIVRPDEPWEALHVAEEALFEGHWGQVMPGAEKTTEIVCVGRPLDGIVVRVASTREQVGEIEAISPGSCEGYLGGGSPLTADGWLRTGDLGHVDARGRLFVLGRTDDVLVVMGRKVAATTIEETVNNLDGVRTGSAVAFVDPDGCLAVALERSASEAEDRPLIAIVRRAVSSRVGVAPAVHLCERDSVPKTPSGKIQRQQAARLFAANSGG